MLTKTALLILLPAFATAAAAEQIPHPLAARALPALQARQTDTTACIEGVFSSIEATVSPFPRIPQGLVGMTDIKPIDDPCNYAPPASMASAFTSYSREVVSWVSESWPKVTSALAKCGPEAKTEIDGYASAWNLIVCSNDVSGAGSKPSATSTGDGAAQTTAAGTGSESQTRATGSQTTNTAGAGSAGSQRTSTAGAARETGFVAGIVAAVGFIGAVAAL